MFRFLLAVAVFFVSVSLWSQETADVPKDVRARMMAEKFQKFAEHDPAVGAEAPAFTLSNLDGKEVKLSDFRDKSYVVLEFGSYT